MAAFDTLAFTKSLEAGGVERKYAEAHALAIRDHVMAEVATKADIDSAVNRVTIRLGSIVVAATGVLLAAFALFQ